MNFSTLALEAHLLAGTTLGDTAFYLLYSTFYCHTVHDSAFQALQHELGLPAGDTESQLCLTLWDAVMNFTGGNFPAYFWQSLSDRVATVRAQQTAVYAQFIDELAAL
ncbi:hypothetical protein ACWOEH_05275 [Enterococcus nangangensis]